MGQHTTVRSFVRSPNPQMLTSSRGPFSIYFSARRSCSILCPVCREHSGLLLRAQHSPYMKWIFAYIVWQWHCRGDRHRAKVFALTGWGDLLYRYKLGWAGRKRAGGAWTGDELELVSSVGETNSLKKDGVSSRHDKARLLLQKGKPGSWGGGLRKPLRSSEHFLCRCCLVTGESEEPIRFKGGFVGAKTIFNLGKGEGVPAYLPSIAYQR